MKTPREILIARHRSAEPKLDSIRQNALADAFPREPAARTEASKSPGNFALRAAFKLWRELILPCRRVWAGLAVAWVLILTVNFATGERPKSLARNSAPPSPQVVLALKEQERMYAKLLELPEEPPDEPPKPFVPRPRGEIHIPVAFA